MVSSAELVKIANHGAMLLSLRDYTAARATLMKALKMIRDFEMQRGVWCTEDLQKTKGTAVAVGSHNAMIEESDSDVNLSIRPTSGPVCPHHLNQETTSFLQLDPLWFDLADIGSSQGWSSKACSIMSMGVIFNLALTHHLLAMTQANRHGRCIPDGIVYEDDQTKTEQGMLLKAVKLYSMALELVPMKELNCTTPCDDTADAVLCCMLAALNNLAQAYHAIGDRSQAENSFGLVLSLSSVTDSSPQRRRHEIVDLFRQSALSGLLSKYHAAGAA